jgi:ABC-type multidrug transport system permease subunit
VIQPIVRALPLTAAIEAMRGNMLQGKGLGQMMMQVGLLLAWFVVPFAISLRIFRWR